MLYKIQNLLNDKNIPNEIKVRTKNIYGIYKRLEQGNKLHDIHDLLALKIMVDEIENCYRTLGIIHMLYNPINHRFKDYICEQNRKTNMYQSLHTTVFGPTERIVQTQIRTFEMDKTASFGLTAYWDIKKGEARYTMQKELTNRFQFFKSLTEINNIFTDNHDFVNQVKTELFANNVYPYTASGIIIELPLGSTIIDYAYKIAPENAHNMVDAYVNDEPVSFDYEIKNKDRIKIVTSDLSLGPTEQWHTIAKTIYAKTKIRNYINSKKIV